MLTPNNTITLPPIEALDQAAAELVAETTEPARIRAIDKAIYAFHQGLTVVPTAGGFLVPSFGDAGIIYRVANVSGCNCKAGARGQPCKHALAIEVIERAAMYTLPAVAPARRAAYDKALAAINELFA